MRPGTPPAPEARLAVLASGPGSTFRALVEASRTGELPAQIVLLIASRDGAGVLEVARELGVDPLVVDLRELGAGTADERMHAALSARSVDLVVLAGYLRKVGPKTLAAFDRRIVNTHPAPLPDFGGHGMYGDHVHRAVLASGRALSAATVHLVDAGYDTGEVIAERPVPVHPGDDVARLRARVQAAERELLVIALRSLITSPASGPVEAGDGGRTRS